MTQYVVTGRDQGVPVPQDLSVIAGHAPGVPFTATIDTDVEARLIGAGLLAHYPPANTVTAQGTADASGKVLTSMASGSNEGQWLAPSGGSGSPGALIVRKFPFAFDTPGLLTGHVVYTPTVGDILYNAWIEIDTAWDGTTPLGDAGQFLAGGAHVGWLRGAAGAVDMTNVDEPAPFAPLLSQGQASGSPSSFFDNWYGTFGFVHRVFPAKFTTADAVRVMVSQDGTGTGADPGSTQGAAVLYLVTATPV